METYQGSQILVTGGAGFVGSNLVNALIEAGANVTVFDDLFTGNSENLKASIDSIVFKEESVNGSYVVERIKRDNYDYIFHLAARNIIASTSDPVLDLQTNIGGTLNLLMACRGLKNLKKFIYTGSVSCYGNPRQPYVNEDDPKVCLSPYSVSKLAGENYCKVFYEQWNVPTTIVRYSNVYGINQRPDNPYCGVVSKFMAQEATKIVSLYMERVSKPEILFM